MDAQDLDWIKVGNVDRLPRRPGENGDDPHAPNLPASFRRSIGGDGGMDARASSPLLLRHCRVEPCNDVVRGQANSHRKK
jgi:hypothetical protein